MSSNDSNAADSSFAMAQEEGRPMKKSRLTKEELATAWFACGHAMAFWKRQGQRKRTIVKYCKAEYQKYADPSAKLDAMLDKP